ncbi:hypothetical protein [Cohnella hongkongensis]|uniref:Uncharacterized protein n=1 Tax=Cohnella hongkongensis TaxID=178337 RepID=A0ABV9F9V6_9BACL
MNQNEVYIVLTATGTLFSETIKWFTKAPLNHASIAFDPELNEVYSFGRKKLRNPFFAGFIQENFKHPFYGQASCAVYRIRVGERGFEQARRLIGEMKQNPERYKYHLLGLIGVLLRRRIPRENAYFCSHFVASVLERCGCRPVDKPACFITPGDFEQSLSGEQIYRGTIAGYLSRYEPNYPAAAYGSAFASVTA